VPAKRAKSRFTPPSRRTRVVWVVFLAAMTLSTGLLALRDAQGPSGFLLTSVDLVGNRPAADFIFDIEKPLDRKRWTGIVIHHLGDPAGDPESITRRHLSKGYQGLGYHFLIGNGNGLGDGVIHVGYRWNQQQPGAHVPGRSQLASHHNQHSIAICVIGNGDRRPFTDRQMAQLASLVQRLQAQLKIPARNVRLHRDLVPQTSNPGTFFPAAQFQEQLLE
jgi:N-acetyl-anhydromuramyl-L-alanine amidase AmpD